MSATTVNEIAPIVMMPPMQNTSVNASERINEPNGYSLITTLLLQTNKALFTSNLLDWCQTFRSLERATHDTTSLPTILEQVYVSSSHSEALNKIVRIRNLISDWDKDFQAPTMETITNSLEIAALFPIKFPVPKISLSSDGEISLELIKGKKHAVIDIDEEDEFSYTYFQRGKFVPGKEKAKLPLNKLPKDLLEYFAS
ncbi:MAG: hypothetical protein NPIRA04_30450 [Nitrospirales bacterium]|nr:MAG: hypothetical protein NPIRA04_30450 [Nitrospirales bacterium]